MQLWWRPGAPPADATVAAEMARAAAAAGCDIIELDATALALEGHAALLAVCADEGLLYLVRAAADAAVPPCHGLALPAHASVGLARARLGHNGVLALRAATAAELALAVETGADLAAHTGGATCAAVFQAWRGRPACPLFAAGVKAIETAEALVRAGVYRLCVEGDGAAVPAELRPYAAALGRTVT